MSYQEELDELTWAIDGNEGQFALILARCNCKNLQEKVINELQTIYAEELIKINLKPSIQTVYTAITNQIELRTIKAVMICDLEINENPEKVFTGANQIREEFRKNCPFPIIWWVTDQILPLIKRLAPDLESWTTTVEFCVDNSALINYVQEITDQVFNKILSNGATRYLDQSFTGFGITASSINELKSAYRELQQRNINLSQFLIASIEFILITNNQISETETLFAYEKNSEFWQQIIDQLELDKKLQKEGIKRKACVDYYLGVWWRTYGIKNRVYYQPACLIAQDYLQKCIELLQTIKDYELFAKFINSVGDILERNQDWKALEELGKQAISLHKKYLNPFRLARAYNLLAEAYFGQKSWENAYQYAQEAVNISLQTNPDSLILNQTHTTARKLEWARSFNQGSYFLSLAKCQLKLNLVDQALLNFQKAKQKTNPNYEPELYITILQYFQNIYYQNKDYLKAFQLKKEILSVEQQFGFRAFIGAGRLKANQRLLESEILLDKIKGKVAQEIVASGRELDIKQLLERIARNDHKLTIIYGPSGVGKSSIIEAGLIPALEEKPIKTRDIYSLLIEVYTDWQKELSKKLKQTFDQNNYSQNLTTLESIIDYLKIQVEKSIIVVLIFDQFEEFFFVNTDLKTRKEFYQFLAQCLEIPHFNVILSVREDYLHYLLEMNRLQDFKIINNNILDKNIIYYLGNFSQENTQNIICSLTKKANLLLETSLIQQLVKDLSSEIGEVRPIELQIIGAQLQADHITTLNQYKEQGTKHELVQRYLTSVIDDCGQENQQLASLILYLLTDENNSRPLKNYNEVYKDLQMFNQEVEYNQEKLDFVLKILVESGLVYLIPDIISTRYQLAHDYLVRFIRQQQGENFIQKIQQAKQAQTKTQNKLNFTLKISLGIATLLIFTLSYQYYLAKQNRILAQHEELNALVNSSTALFASNQNFSALIEGLKAANKLKKITNNQPKKSELYNQVVTILQEAIFWVRESNSIKAHQGRINDISLSKDGKIIASVSDDKTIKLWQFNGNLIKVIGDQNSFLDQNHSAPILAVEISPDQRFIVTGSNDQTVKIWKLDGTFVKTLVGHQKAVNQVSISSNGKLIASASNDGTVKLWTIEGELIRTLKIDHDSIRDIKFTPNSAMLAAVGNDGDINLWTVEGQLIKAIKGNYHNVFESNLHEQKTLEELSKLTLLNSRLNSIDFSPDGQTIITGSLDQNIYLWTIEGKLIKTINNNSGGLNDLKFSPDGKTIASANVDKTIKIWSLDGTLLHTLSGHNSQVINIEFTPDGKNLISASGDHSLKIWQLDQVFVKTLRGHQNTITDFSFAPKAQIFASVSYNEFIKIWSTQGEILQTIPIDIDQTVNKISLDQTGNYLALGDYNGTIEIWQKDATNQFIFKQKFSTNQQEFKKILWSPNSKIIASTGDDNTIKLWDLQGNLIRQIDKDQEYPQPILNLAFSPDGNMIADVTADFLIKLWNIDGTLNNIFKGHQGAIDDIIFSNDGTKIISASQDNTVKIWSKNGQLINTLNGVEGHQDLVLAVAFNNQNNLIASGSNDHTIKLWTLDGKIFSTLRGHNSGINHLVFNEKKSQLIALTDDNRIIIWNLKNIGDLDQLLNLGCNWLNDYLNIHADQSINLICQSQSSID